MREVKEDGRERRVVEGEMKTKSVFGLLMIGGDCTAGGWEGRALNCDDSIEAKAVKGVEVSRVVLITMARAVLARSRARVTFIPGISVRHRLQPGIIWYPVVGAYTPAPAHTCPGT